MEWNFKKVAKRRIGQCGPASRVRAFHRRDAILASTHVADNHCGRGKESREAGGLEEVGLLVASGGAERNPRWVKGKDVGLEEVAMPVVAYGIDASSRLSLLWVLVPRVPLRSTRGY